MFFLPSLTITLEEPQRKSSIPALIFEKKVVASCIVRTRRNRVLMKNITGQIIGIYTEVLVHQIGD